MALITNKKFSKTPREQLEQVLKQKKTGNKKHAWDTFFGKVKWPANPVAFQRNLRHE